MSTELTQIMGRNRPGTATGVAASAVEPPDGEVVAHHLRGGPPGPRPVGSWIRVSAPSIPVFSTWRCGVRPALNGSVATRSRQVGRRRTGGMTGCMASPWRSTPSHMTPPVRIILDYWGRHNL